MRARAPLRFRRLAHRAAAASTPCGRSVADRCWSCAGWCWASRWSHSPGHWCSPSCGCHLTCCGGQTWLLGDRGSRGRTASRPAANTGLDAPNQAQPPGGADPLPSVSIVAPVWCARAWCCLPRRAGAPPPDAPGSPL